MPMIDVGAAAPFGYVRAVISQRVKGHAAPLDLVRAHLRAVGIRRRCRAAFADYLVSDELPAFSDRRAVYAGQSDSMCMTGGEADRPDGNLDAPDCIAAGYGKRFATGDGLLMAAPVFVFRDGWYK